MVTLPDNFPRRPLLGLLGKYLERRSCFKSGVKLPEYRPIIEMKLRGKTGVWFVPVEWACCEVRGTKQREHDNADEMGCCLNKLSEHEQGLIVNDFLLRGDEWTIWQRSIDGSERRFRKLVRVAWRRLHLNALKAGLC